MADWTVPEAMGMFVAVVLALSLVSFLAYAKMTQGGVPPGRKRQALVSLWLIVFGLIALLFALQVVGGGPTIGRKPGGGIWLGLEPRQVVAMLVAIVLLVVGYAGVRKVLGPLEAAGPPGPPPAEPPSETEQET